MKLEKKARLGGDIVTQPYCRIKQSCDARSGCRLSNHFKKVVMEVSWGNRLLVPLVAITSNTSWSMFVGMWNMHHGEILISKILNPARIMPKEALLIAFHLVFLDFWLRTSVAIAPHDDAEACMRQPLCFEVSLDSVGQRLQKWQPHLCPPPPMTHLKLRVLQKGGRSTEHWLK